MNMRNTFINSAFVIGAIVIAGVSGFILAQRQNANVVRRSQETAIVDDSLPRTQEYQQSSYEDISGGSRDRFDGSITFKGEKYEVNTAVDKVLFLGIDQSDQTRKGIGIQEGGRSDAIILFAIDNERKAITPLEINRDTMVQVDIYDNSGEFLTRGEEQLTMQYSYGDSPRKASNLTREKVSDLLGRTRIDSVVALTMDGIEPVVDSIGGVVMKLETDETDFSPSYTKGAVINLDGPSAKAFIHDRDVTVRGSNIARMNRQTQFMLALFKNIHEKGGEVLTTMEEAAGDYLYEDIDADSMDHFADYEFDGEVVTLPGENVEGTLHDEFYVDEEGVMEVVLKLFYKKAGN
jgi:LCP family protein required for cell wall assembly